MKGARGGAQGFVATLTVLLVLLGATLYAQLPVPSPLPSLRSMAPAYESIWPQGWSFFSSEADSPMLSTFRVDADGTLSTVSTRMMSAENDWGVGREAVSAYDETHYLADDVAPKAWTVCARALAPRCLSSATTTHLVDRFQPADVCGTLVFVLTQPDALQRARGSVAGAPGRVSKAVVTCPA